MRTSLYILVACLTIVGISAASQDAATDVDSAPYSLPDTLFVEINLGPDGVWAVDSSGNEWHYDFQLEEFVSGPLEPVGEGTSVEFGNQRRPRLDGNSDIERRATERVRPEPFSRKSITINSDEYVDGDVVAWGRVTVKGWVKGNVVSMQKRVLVTATGRVDGDIEAPEIVVAEGGVVLGKTTENTGWVPEELASSFSADGLIVAIVFTGVALLLGFMFTALMPKQTRRICDCTNAYTGRSLGLGVLLVIGSPMVVVLLVITVVGILLVPAVPFLYLGAGAMGLVAHGATLAARVSGQGSDRQCSVGKTMLGVFILMAPWLLTAILRGSSNAVLDGFGVFVLVISILITVYICGSGIGSVALTRFGTREYTADRDGRRGSPTAPRPAPPPIPEPPRLSRDQSTPATPNETSGDGFRKMGQDD